MKPRLLTMLSAALVAASAALVPLVAHADEYAPYVIMLSPGGDPAALADDVVEHGGEVRYVYTDIGPGVAATLWTSTLTAVISTHPVKSVERDRPIVKYAEQLDPPSWGLDRIDQRGNDLDNTYRYQSTGAGVSAYIVDTGILATHDEFSGRVTLGRDYIGATGADCDGHGTHVAGTTGGTTYGVAKAVALVNVRVLDCAGEGRLSDGVDALNWIARDHASGVPAVANLSWGLEGRPRNRSTPRCARSSATGSP